MDNNIPLLTSSSMCLWKYFENWGSLLKMFRFMLSHFRERLSTLAKNSWVLSLSIMPFSFLASLPKISLRISSFSKDKPKSATVDCTYQWMHSIKTCFHVTSIVWVSGVKLWSFLTQSGIILVFWAAELEFTISITNNDSCAISPKEVRVMRTHKTLWS